MKYALLPKVMVRVIEQNLFCFSNNVSLKSFKKCNFLVSKDKLVLRLKNKTNYLRCIKT